MVNCMERTTNRVQNRCTSVPPMWWILGDNILRTVPHSNFGEIVGISDVSLPYWSPHRMQADEWI